jgi:hypothetical protein
VNQKTEDITCLSHAWQLALTAVFFKATRRPHRNQILIIGTDQQRNDGDEEELLPEAAGDPCCQHGLWPMSVAGISETIPVFVTCYRFATSRPDACKAVEVENWPLSRTKVPCKF